MRTPSVQRNVIWLIVTEFVTRIILFAVVVWLTNSLGSKAYGQLSYVFAIANLCVVIADFGLHTYVTRLVAGSLQDWQQQRRTIVYLKLLGSAVALLLTVGIVTWRSSLDLLTIAAGAVAIIAVSGRTFSEAIARGRQRMHLEASSKLVHTALQALALSLALLWQLPLEEIALAYAISALLGWLFSLRLVKAELTSPRTSSTLSVGQLISAVMPFAASIAINAQFNYLDSAILGWLRPAEEVGWYTAAYKPIFFITSLAGLVIASFFPRIAQLWKAGQYAEAKQTVRKLLRTLMLAGWPMAVVGTVVAPWLFSFLYKPEYAPAVIPFTILLWNTLAIYFWAPLGNSLQAIGQEKVYARNFILAAIVNAPLTLICVWQWAYIGAAIATLCTQLLLAALMYRDARRHLLTN